MLNWSGRQVPNSAQQLLKSQSNIIKKFGHKTFNVIFLLSDWRALQHQQRCSVIAFSVTSEKFDGIKVLMVTCVARPDGWIEKLKCFIAQLGGRAFLHQDLAKICSDQVLL